MFFPCVETSQGLLAHARSRLLQAFGRETLEAAALRQAAEIAGTATLIVDPLQRILEVALPVLPVDHLALLYVSTDRSECVIVAAAGAADVWRWRRAPLRAGIAARAIETGEAQLVSDAVLVVPVILRGSVFGVLETTDERRRFTPRHVTLLRVFADQCAIAIDNTRGGNRIRA